MSSELDLLKEVYKRAKDFLKFMDDSYSNIHTDLDKEEEIRGHLVIAIRNYEKPKKKLKLYSPIAKSHAGYTYLFGRYTDKKEHFSAGGEKIIGWHEIEVEVDE